jgi:hypothetical protein
VSYRGAILRSTPKKRPTGVSERRDSQPFTTADLGEMVGDTGLEPMTSTV